MTQWHDVASRGDRGTRTVLAAAVLLGLAVLDDGTPGGTMGRLALAAARRDSAAKKPAGKKPDRDAKADEESEWEDDTPASKGGKSGQAPAKTSRWTDERSGAKPAGQAGPSAKMAPAQLWAEAVRLFEMGQYKDAASYFAVFAGSRPSGELLLSIQRRHGPGYFLRLHAQKPLREVAERLAKMVDQAVAGARDDPKRIAHVVELLRGNMHDRALAMARLQVIGVRALPALLVAVARRREAAFGTHVVRAIRYMGFQAVPGLVAVLDSRNARMVQFALMALTDLGDPSVAPWIRAVQQNPKALTPMRAAAEAALRRIIDSDPTRLPPATTMLLAVARRHYHRRYDPLEDRSTVRIWSWSDKKGLSWRELRGEAAADWLAFDACRRAYRLAPQDPTVRVMYVCVALAQAEPLGPNDPWHLSPGSAASLARVLPWQVLSECLTQAMADGKHHVALRLCEILGQVGREDMLTLPPPHRCALVQAVAWPDRRVQIQAALSVVGAWPRRRFPGSRHIVSVLCQGFQMQSKLRVLIVDASATRAATSRVRWQRLGWVAKVADSMATARQTLKQESPFDLITAAGDLRSPDLLETVRLLRGLERSHAVPIVAILSLDRRRALGRKLEQIGRVWLMPSGTSDEQFASRAVGLVRGLGLTPLTPAESDRLADATLHVLLDLAGDGACPFDVTVAQEALIDALSVPTRAVLAARVLGRIASAKAQRTLCSRIVAPTTDAKLRPALMRALADSLRRRPGQIPRKQRESLVQSMLGLKDPELRRLGLEIASLTDPDAKVQQDAFGRLRPAEPKAAAPAAPAPGAPAAP